MKPNNTAITAITSIRETSKKTKGNLLLSPKKTHISDEPKIPFDKYFEKAYQEGSELGNEVKMLKDVDKNIQKTNVSEILPDYLGKNIDISI